MLTCAWTSNASKRLGRDVFPSSSPANSQLLPRSAVRPLLSRVRCRAIPLMRRSKPGAKGKGDGGKGDGSAATAQAPSLPEYLRHLTATSCSVAVRAKPGCKVRRAPEWAAARRSERPPAGRPPSQTIIPPNQGGVRRIGRAMRLSPCAPSPPPPTPPPPSPTTPTTPPHPHPTCCTAASHSYPPTPRRCATLALSLAR